MPSKTTSSSKRGNANNAVEGADEEPLVAVVLADSFDGRFQPLTLRRPRCLLPFCGVPLLNFTLERLLAAGVSKCHILANSHATLVRSHVDSLRKAGALAGIDVVVYAVPDARSVGDAMRELDAKELIRGDFILVQPDCVGNVDIKEQVRAHVERRKVDKDAIMTIGVQSGAAGQRSAILALRPETEQLLHYDHLTTTTSKTHLPFEEVFSDSTPTAELRMDLRETGIDICSLDVPPLFSENFDYQTLRRDFVVGILTSDLLESRIYVHEGKRAAVASAAGTSKAPSLPVYGARCDSTRAYDEAALDVLSQRAWPTSPGSPAWPGERLEARSGARYVGVRNVQVDRTADVRDRVLISSGVTVAARACVEASTLSLGVSVGEEATVVGLHLFEGASIGKGCHVSSSILGRNVRVLDGVRIGKGCLIGDECVVGKDLKAGTRVVISDEGDNDEALLGPQGVGHAYVGEDEDEDDDDDEEGGEETDAALRIGHAHARVIDDDLSSVEGDSELGDSDSETDDDDDMADGTPATTMVSGMGNLSLNAGEVTDYETAAATERLREFESEARASLHRAFEEGHTIDNASIELKTLRMASNVPLSEVRRCVTEALLQGCVAFSDGGSDAKKMGSWLDRWDGLLAQVIDSNGSEGEEEQQGSEVIECMQTYCATHAETHSGLFVPLLKKLYNDDVLSDEAIVAWWKSPASRQVEERDGGEARMELRRKAEPVVRWVVEQGQESESEEESGEESD